MPDMFSALMKKVPQLMFAWVAALMLLCCSLASAGESDGNTIHLLPTGDMSASQPAPAADGSVLFVTSTIQGREIARWSPHEGVSLWDDYPSDDDSPAISPDGRWVAYVSTRKHPGGQVWVKRLTGGTAWPLHAASGAQRNPVFVDDSHIVYAQEVHGVWQQYASILPGIQGGLDPRTIAQPSIHSRYRVEIPFDSNGDGHRDRNDLSWIVDISSPDHRPLTPLVLDATDPVIEPGSGHLWFSLNLHGRQRIGWIAQPDKSVKSDLVLAAESQWAILTHFQGQQHDDAWWVQWVEKIWHAGYSGFARRIITQLEQRHVHLPIMAWQRFRLAWYDGKGAYPEQRIRSWIRRMDQNDQLQAARMRLDAVHALRVRSRSLDALPLLDAIHHPAFRRQAMAEAAAIELAAGRPDLALARLAEAWPKPQEALTDRMIALVAQCAGAGDDDDVGATLRNRLAVAADQYPGDFIVIWRLQLARHYQAEGSPASALQLLTSAAHSSHIQRNKTGLLHIHPVLQHQRARLLQQLRISLAMQKMQTDDYPQAFKLASTVMRDMPWHLVAARLFFASAAHAGLMAQADTMWKGWYKQGLPHADMAYIEALRLSYKASKKARAVRLLKQFLDTYPTHWAALQTLGWLTEQGKGAENIGSLRQALKLYQRAQLTVAGAGFDFPGQVLRQNIINLAFRLKQYELVLLEMSVWRGQATAQIPLTTKIKLELQAARAAYHRHHWQLARQWLAALPTVLPAQWQMLAQRLQTLIDVAQQQHQEAADGFQALSQDDSLNITKIRRYQLDGALAAYLAGDSRKAENQLMALLAEGKKSARPGMGILHLGDFQMPLSESWVAAALLADIYRDKGDWQQQEAMLQIKLAGLKGNSQIKAHTLFDLAMARMQQSHWHRALGVLGKAEAVASAIHDDKALEHIQFYANVIHQSLDASSNQPFDSSDDHLQGNAWFQWWMQSVVGNKERKHFARSINQLKSIISQETHRYPWQDRMIQRFFFAAINGALAGDDGRAALNLLLSYERTLTQAHVWHVAGRPMPAARSIKKLRRQLRPHEGIALLYGSPQAGTLWWLDGKTILHRSWSKADPAQPMQILADWSQQADRIALVAIDHPWQWEPLVHDTKSLHIVFSPTMIHAPYLLHQQSSQQHTILAQSLAKDDGLFSESLWQQADAAVRDWQWHLRLGLTAVHGEQWPEAFTHLAAAIRMGMPKRFRHRVFKLAAQAALNMGAPDRALQLFSTVPAKALPDGLYLHLHAVRQEHGGALLQAMEDWQQFMKVRPAWRDQAMAAQALVRISLRAGGDVTPVWQILSRTIDLIPSKEESVRSGLLMSRATLSVHRRMGQLSDKEIQRDLDAAKEGGQRASIPLQLLQLTFDWKRNHLNGITARLDRLRQQIPTSDLNRFDLETQAGLIFTTMGQPGRAATHFEQAYAVLKQHRLHISGERAAALANNRGRLAESMHQYDLAEIHYHNALMIDLARGDKFGIMYDHRNLASLALHRRQWKALAEQVQQGLDLARRLQSKPLLAELYLIDLTGRFFRHTLRPQELMAAKQVLSGLHRFDLQWRWHWLQGEWLRLHGGKDRAQQAFDRALKIVQRHILVSAANRADINHLFSAMLQMLPTDQPGQLRALWLSEQFRRIAYRTALAENQINSKPTLPDSATLVLYPADQYTYAWWVAQGRVQQFSKIALSRQQLHQQISGFIDAVSHGFPVHHKARQLYRQLMKPFAAHIVQGGDLTIIASGMLDRLPFSALHDGQHWLLEQLTIVNTPLLTGIAHHKSEPMRKAITHVVKGDYTTRRDQLPLLDEEARAVADFQPGKVVISPHPTAMQLMRSLHSATWVHLLAHAHEQDVAPWYSFIRLSDADAAPLFTLQQLRQQHLQACTVIISACGAESPSITHARIFPRAWLLAGSTRVISSQWQANDTASAILMKWMYQSLAQGISLADSLRQAKLQMLHRFPHPEYWAGMRLDRVGLGNEQEK